jgi:hypothetical protein
MANADSLKSEVPFITRKLQYFDLRLNAWDQAGQPGARTLNTEQFLTALLRQTNQGQVLWLICLKYLLNLPWCGILHLFGAYAPFLLRRRSP